MPIRIIPTSTIPPSSPWPWIACRNRPAAHDYRAALARAREWIVGMQSENGAWGAFDADNEFHYLNNIPFADHGALLDPPTEDVTARCVSMLAQFGESAATSAVMRARARLFAPHPACRRQLVRPLGHELHLRHLVGAMRAQRAGLDPAEPAVRRAADWLISIQNADGGWGEDGAATSWTTAAMSRRPARPRRPRGR